MASTVKIYEPTGSVYLGSATAAAASRTLTSWVPITTVENPVILLNRVMILVTQAGTHVGRSWVTRVRTDNGAGTLTVDDACPFVGA